jgi:hypothetical protein
MTHSGGFGGVRADVAEDGELGAGVSEPTPDVDLGDATSAEWGLSSFWGRGFGEEV